MNKKSLSLKVDEYTIHLHRGQEESEEMQQKRMALYVSCLRKIMREIMTKYFNYRYIKSGYKMVYSFEPQVMKQ